MVHFAYPLLPNNFSAIIFLEWIVYYLDTVLTNLFPPIFEANGGVKSGGKQLVRKRRLRDRKRIVLPGANAQDYIKPHAPLVVVILPEGTAFV